MTRAECFEMAEELMEGFEILVWEEDDEGGEGGAGCESEKSLDPSNPSQPLLDPLSLE